MLFILIKRIIERVKEIIKNLKSISFPRWCIHWKQKYITQGFSDEDTWSLDYTTAKYILPRLKRFKELTNSVPSSIYQEDIRIENQIEEWKKIIDKMILAFELVIKNGDGDILTDEEYNQIDEGLKLFAKYYLNLWW